jgi:hypothetical protein
VSHSMSQSAILQAPKRQWLACIATVAGVLLGECAMAVPAHSADFYSSEPYPAPSYQNESYRYAPVPSSYYQGAAYRSNCAPCGCSSCGCSPCGCGRCGCTWRCGAAVQPRGHVIERRVVEREYYERRYALGGHRQYRSYGYEEPQWSANPAPAEYEEPRSTSFPYGYGGVRRGSYDYSEAPRPPAAVMGRPGGYYYGYPE